VTSLLRMSQYQMKEVAYKKKHFTLPAIRNQYHPEKGV